MVISTKSGFNIRFGDDNPIKKQNDTWFHRSIVKTKTYMERSLANKKKNDSIEYSTNHSTLLSLAQNSMRHFLQLGGKIQEHLRLANGNQERNSKALSKQGISITIQKTSFKPTTIHVMTKCFPWITLTHWRHRHANGWIWPANGLCIRDKTMKPWWIQFLKLP